MRIAIFDYQVVATNPAGSCHRLLIHRLCEKFQFTVFSCKFDNPRPDRVQWVRVPSLSRPLALLFICFHLVARWTYLRRRGAGFRIVQSVESNLAFGDVVYAHFCHRWFLRNKWKQCRPGGLRGAARWLDHVLHAALEPLALRRAKGIVAASPSLAKELLDEYPSISHKLRVIPNPVDLDSYERPAEFPYEQFRAQFGLAPRDLLIVFVALGHFERKGLPLLLKALSEMTTQRMKLCVVGGSAATVRAFSRQVAELDLEGRVFFEGFKSDIRPYLWAADLLALPSFYEVFPLVVLQAAAAGCPLLVTKEGGGDQMGGAGCIIVDPCSKDILRGLQEIERLSPSELRTFGEAARRAAQEFSASRFVSSWERFYMETQWGANG